MSELKTKKLPRDQIVHIHKVDNNQKMEPRKPFPMTYNNIYICAKKASGKSTVVHNLVQRLYRKHAQIIVFSPTCHNDSIYESLKNWADEKAQKEHEEYLEKLEEAEEEPTSEDLEFNPNIHMYTDFDEDGAFDDLDSHFKVRNDTNIEYIVIIDDMGDNARQKKVANLARRNRHAKANIITSTQSMKDTTPPFIANTDAVILFGGHEPHHLMHLHDKTGIKTPFDKFHKAYLDATKEKHGFFYLDTRNNKLYKNFEEEYL